MFQTQIHTSDILDNIEFVAQFHEILLRLTLLLSLHEVNEKYVLGIEVHIRPIVLASLFY
jgi:hypothetical protein